MRKLKTPDVFELARTILKIGIKEDLKKICMKAEKVSEITEERGYELLFSVLEKACEKKSEKLVYEFLAGPFEITSQEVEDMDLDVMIENVIQLAKDNNLVHFFKLAVNLKK